MEDRGKRKLLDTTVSSQGHAVRAATEGLIDRLSDLPDHVAHHILSFLEITDLTRFGCVSKGCRELYLATPSLNFDGFSSKHLQGYDQRLRLWSYLDRYFFHRGVNRIERFRIHWDLHYADQQESLREDERFRLDKWIYNAIRNNVEFLDINIKDWDWQALPFPPCILLGGSLKSLSVHMYGKIFKAPSPASFTNLECLKLQGVILVDEGLFKWISIHHLYITGEKLRKIIIDWRFGIRTDKPHTDKLLNISAPNLISLNWTGSLMNQHNLGRLECLDEANICLLPNVDEFVYVSEVLSCLSSAKVLALNKETTMALFKGGSVPLLKNVCYLCIHIEGFLDILVPAMTSLLAGLSKLSTLIIKSDSFFRGPTADCCGFNMGYWKLQNTAFIYQLKEVTIELSHGSNGIEFARYILDHAQNLNKMTIVHSPQQSKAMST
ncbi:hypothetical protein ABKV19_020863 [Rosa sericea]